MKKRARDDDVVEEEQVDEKISEFRKLMTERSKVIFNQVMPEKLKSLTQMLEGAPFTVDAGSIHDDGVSKSNNGVVEVACNETIVRVVDLLKLELASFVENVSTLKVWVQLCVPSISDGNNFGVGVQEDCIQELARAEESAFNGMDTISKYFLQRAKLVTKRVKYPKIADYDRCVKETDEKLFYTLKLVLMDLRNNTGLLHDMLTKNWTKIVAPRGNSDSVAAMY